MPLCILRSFAKKYLLESFRLNTVRVRSESMAVHPVAHVATAVKLVESYGSTALCTPNCTFLTRYEYPFTSHLEV